MDRALIPPAMMSCGKMHGIRPPVNVRTRRGSNGSKQPMELSAFFPTRTIGNDPAKIRDWAQTAEDLGYDHIEVPDHVFGATARGDWQPIYTEKDAFHETLRRSRSSPL
jgi:hypothetical protein